MVFRLYPSSDGSWGCRSVALPRILEANITPHLPNSSLYACSEAREIRSLESLKLIFTLNYRFEVPDTRSSLITLLTLDAFGPSWNKCFTVAHHSLRS